MYVIQDIVSGIYAPHADSLDQAERWEQFELACYAATYQLEPERQWRIIEQTTGKSFVLDPTGVFKAETDVPELDDEAQPTNKFQWLDRLGCVEKLAIESADNGGGI